MMFRILTAAAQTAVAGRPRAASRARTAALILLTFAELNSASAAYDFSLGQKEVVYTAAQRRGKKLNNWPDGNLGVIANGNGTYDFYAANTSTPVKTTGTLSDPARYGKRNVTIANVPRRTYSYVAGGPVYEDEATGARLMVYHAEIRYSGKYSSVLGLAASTDPSGLTFYDLGPIIEPNIPVGQSPFSVDIGGGTFAVLDDQFHVYFRDYMADGTSSELAVARAPLADLVSNSLSGIATPFTKYYDGAWSEPGRRGKSSPLEVGNPANWWSSVSYNEYLDELVLVTSQWQSGGSGPDLYLTTSPDGVNWAPRQHLGLEAGEQMYPTIVGTGADPQLTGQSFYVYYTSGSRWRQAQLARRHITFDPTDGPPDAPTDPNPLPTEWSIVSDYRADFQTGTPAAGWSYAWNPTGSLANSASFAPLAWSDVAQAYNTTGAATPVPAGKLTHADDYLHLSAVGGHPGRPGYMPIAGYTIQADDGAGLYRIADSSIQKIDGSLSPREDGLAVLVCLNDTPIGAAANVSTNGAISGFDRDLGPLDVGDTVWVMVSALANQDYDSFAGFDFTIQKAVPVVLGLTVAAVPEPGGAVLVLLGVLVGCAARRGRRW